MYANRYLKIFDVDSKLLDERKKRKDIKKYMISFYKSIVDQDRASIVICNLKHEIIYMNPAAVNNYTEGLTTMWSTYRQLKENRQILS